MSRPLPSRCFIGSVLGHTVLCVLLIFAPGFQTKPTDLATGGVTLEIISSDLVNGALAPLASEEPPAPAPAAEQAVERATVAPEPPPTPPPVRVPEPEVVPARPEPRTPTKSALDAPESNSRDFVVPTRKAPEKKSPPKTPPKKKEEPKFDFSQAQSVPESKTRKAAPSKETARNSTPVEDPSKARARALGGILAQATGSLTGTGGGRGAVNIQISGGGPGTGGGAGGGVGSVNALSIRNAYFAAWVPPPNVTDDLATVETEVTIQRDGTVTRARVTRRSGIAALDRSIDDALQRVKRIAPFDAYPDPALEQQTFKIGFNLRARRQF
ncbi:MAG: TonB C-terminal domain-containing protein [Verrucomicrobiales bacterium]|nr:TonB C-terminal domain-containing protein [Verrucomicrobiales bacterium]